MTPETVKAVADAFAPVAQKIGEGAQYGWQVVLWQQQLNGVADMLWAVAPLLVAIASVYGGIKAFKSRDEDWVGLGVFAWFIAAIALVVCGNLVFDGVTHFLNPAYYALQFFISLGAGH